ncbi:MAG: protease modulator HflC [Pseudomonadales bacterium]|jgi:modulator of FtsH protease HflC|nr:protease modulator HflC [Pseudomonadales bacterium]MDP4640796.1 protease modulator HflC [Pseudomonadales bacterium]MDP4765841.1 protease modulator HflC [Pseudomonadales bacterium]MDP4875043.1 protease modulator HflC [Pseudomonadales bacterium]MDP4912740.1 protease modulator HflC [Pseudomonadales bacterium]
MSIRAMVLVFILAVLGVLGVNSVFVVSELERAVLLEFGKVISADIKPGLHLKKPFINEVRKFDARVLTLDANPERFLTLEKKAVIVDSFAKFKVNDAQLFYTATSGDERRAEALLRQRINNGLRNEISKRSLHEVVSGERDELMSVLTLRLDEVARQELGVEVVDVRVKRIDLPPEVSQSVYDRMNTERDIEAREHRAQGQELAAGIRADASKQREVILAEAYADAEGIRGDGDAGAAALYAAAFSRDIEFYKFYRSMAAYQRTFADKSDVMIIDPDSEFFKYLNKSKY